MTRPRPAPPASHPSAPATVTVRLTPQAARILDELVASGLFGWSREDAAERLLCESLRGAGLDDGDGA